MDHQSTVADCPSGTTIALLTNKSIFDAQAVMRKAVFVEQMTKSFVEFVVAVVANLQQAVLDPERSCRIFAHIFKADLWCPTIEILTVEQLNPLFAVGRFCTARRMNHVGQTNNQNQLSHRNLSWLVGNSIILATHDEDV